MSLSPGPPPLRVGMAGYGFMGAAHSHAWRTAPHFFRLPRAPQMTAIAGRDTDAVRKAAEELGWDSAETGWRRLIERPDIDLVDICTPGDTHAEIAIAALQAGKHVLCEKPLANSVAEAESMARRRRARQRPAVSSPCAATHYRTTPALALAKRLVEQGRLGVIRQMRAQYLQDWLCDENGPMTWRLDKSKAGSGALGDIGAHIIDGCAVDHGQQITGVSALMETFVARAAHQWRARRTRRAWRQSPGQPPGAGHRRRRRTLQARLTGGADRYLRSHPIRPRPQERQRLEVNGSAGSLAFDFEDMNVLQVFDGSDAPETRGFQRVQVTEPVPSVHESLVAARARHWLRARVHPPGRRSARAHRRAAPAAALVRRRVAGPARPGAVEDSAGNGSRWPRG